MAKKNSQKGMYLLYKQFLKIGETKNVLYCMYFMYILVYKYTKKNYECGVTDRNTFAVNLSSYKREMWTFTETLTYFHAQKNNLYKHPVFHFCLVFKWP